MADNKVLQTRLKLKIDTLAKWQEVWETFVPLKGEKILFQIPSGTAQTVEGNGITTPQVISKTGDGSTSLKNLPWDSALAADVAAWAKPGNKDYVDVSDLKDRVDDLEENLVPDHRTLTINGIAYDPVGAANVALTLAANTGLELTKQDNTLTITGKVAGTELGMVKNGGNVTIDADGKMTADGVDEADHAANADYADEAGKVTNALTLKVGDTEVVYDGSVKDQVFEVTAADLGINTPFDFIGITTTVLKDGNDTKPIAIKNGASEYTPVAGDIVILDNTDKEFVYTGSVWEELGDAAALTDAVGKLEAKTITAGDELTWTGTLGANPKIDHDKKLGAVFTGTSNSEAATITAGSGEKTINIPKVNVNEFGHVTAISNETVKITIPALTIDDAEKAATAPDTTLVGGVAIDATKNEIIVQKKTVSTNKTASALEVTGDEDEIKIGFKNQNQTANDIIFGDETWHGALRDDFIVFDCGSATMSEAEKTYATILS